MKVKTISSLNASKVVEKVCEDNNDTYIPFQKKQREFFYSFKKSPKTIIVFILLLISIISVPVIYSIISQNNKNFYYGSWKLELVDTEKSNGISEFIYEFANDGKLVNRISSNAAELQIDIITSEAYKAKKVKEGVEITSKDQKIVSVDIKGAEEHTSDTLTDQFKQAFQNEIDKQPKESQFLVKKKGSNSIEIIEKGVIRSLKKVEK